MGGGAGVPLGRFSGRTRHLVLALSEFNALGIETSSH